MHLRVFSVDTQASNAIIVVTIQGQLLLKAYGLQVLLGVDLAGLSLQC